LGSPKGAPEEPKKPWSALLKKEDKKKGPSINPFHSSPGFRVLKKLGITRGTDALSPSGCFQAAGNKTKLQNEGNKKKKKKNKRRKKERFGERRRVGGRFFWGLPAELNERSEKKRREKRKQRKKGYSGKTTKEEGPKFCKNR